MGKFRIVYTGWKAMEIEAADAADAENKFWREHYGECEVKNADFAYADDITNAEYVYHEPGYEDEWICLCGNTASADGFYAIDEGNHEVEPTEEDWKTHQYACGDCGRVIDNDTRRVVRRLNPATIVRLEQTRNIHEQATMHPTHRKYRLSDPASPRSRRYWPTTSFLSVR